MLSKNIILGISTFGLATAIVSPALAKVASPPAARPTSAPSADKLSLDRHEGRDRRGHHGGGSHHGHGHGHDDDGDDDDHPASP